MTDIVEHSSKKPTFLIHFSWSAFGTMGSAVIRFCVLVLLARLIDASAFGLYSFAVITIGLLTNLTDFGLSAAYIQSQQKNNERLGCIVLINVLLAALASLCLYSLFPLINDFFGAELSEPLFLCILACLMMKALGMSAEASLMKAHRFKVLNIIELTSYLLAYGVVGTLMAVLGFGVWALFIAMLLQFVIKTLVCIITSNIQLRIHWNTEVMKRLFHYGAGLTFGNIGNYLANQGDQLLISKLLGFTALGHYGRSFQLAIMPANMLGQAIEKVLFPTMSRLDKASNQFYSYYVKAFLIIFTVSIPLSFLLSQVGSNLVLLLLGDQWQVASELFPIMVLAITLRIANKISDSYYRALGAVYIRGLLQWIFLGNMVIAVCISYEWGLVPLVKTLLIASCVSSTLLIVVLCRKLNGSFLKLMLILGEVITLSMAVLIAVNTLTDFLSLDASKILQLLLITILWLMLTLTIFALRTKIGPQTDFTLFLSQVKLRFLS